MSGELDLSGDEPQEEAASKKEDEAKPKRGGGRPTRPASEADLRKRIEDGIGELVEFVERRLDWPEVAATIREDQTKMAEVLAARAARHARLAQALTRIFGKDSLLAFARAFGPTLRSIGGRFHGWQKERAEQLESEEQPGDFTHSA